MASDKFQVKYDQLDQVAGRFSSQAQAIQDMLQKVKNSLEKLENGGWIGRGSQAFFAEMNGEVLPATRRLYDALEEGSRVTKQISQTAKQAEEQASAAFRV